jgi:hypothetical protein
MSFMEASEFGTYGSWHDPKSPSVIPLQEGNLYSIDCGLYDLHAVMVMPTVLLLEMPKITEENEMRAFCLIVDAGSSGVTVGRYAYPLAHSFRRASI